MTHVMARNRRTQVRTSATQATPSLAPRRGTGERRAWIDTVIGVVILAVLLFPLYWMINASFQPSGELLKPHPSYFPTTFTLDGYRSTFATQGGNVVTSLIVSLGTVVITLLLATPAAYALAKLRVPSRTSLMLVVITVQMIPGIVMANALYIVFARLHLIDNYLGLMLADATTAVPFAILIMRAFMQDIPQELMEAARIDGAGELGVFRSIIVPMSRNSIITAGLFAFLHGWSDFLFAVTLTTGSAFTPVTVGIYRFMGAQTADWNGVMATATVASIPAVFLLILVQKYIAAGITGGAVKE
jgi:multiple sugar transport system permease protein